MSSKAQRDQLRIRVDAPADMDRLDIAQAIVGPDTLLKAEYHPLPRDPFEKSKALGELLAMVEDRYTARVGAMVADIREVIRSEVLSQAAPEHEIYEELRREHRGTLKALAAFDRRPTRGSARKLARRLVDHLPEHFKTEQDHNVPGCRCFEHPEILKTAQKALISYDGAPILRKLLPKLRAHIAHEEEAWNRLRKAEADPFVEYAAIQKIADLVVAHHAAFVAEFGGANTKAEVARLVKDGLLPESAMSVTFDAFTYGKIISAVESRRALARMKKDSFKHVTTLAKKPEYKLTKEQKHAVEWANHRTSDYIRNFGNKLGHSLTQRMQELGNDFTEWRKLASDLGHDTGEWRRDLKRVAATEMQRAFQEGVAHGLKEKHGPSALVFKRPNPDACDACVKLHLTAGRGSPPRLFFLSELIDNGSNVGRRKRDWKPVVGTVHPWCFPPETDIQTESGTKKISEVAVGDLVVTHANRLRAVQRLSQRAFRGNLIVLSTGSESLKLTPEHPLLTAKGWLRADEIQLGDNLLQIHEAILPDKQSNDVPAQDLEESFLSRILCSLPVAVMPAGIYFDDDAKQGGTEVGVVRPYRELWHEVIAYLRQLVLGSPLEGCENPLMLSCLSRLDLLPNRAGFSSDSGVRCLREALSIFRAATTSYDYSLLRARAQSDTRSSETGGDGPPSHCVLLSQLFDAVSEQVRLDDFFGGELYSSGHDVAYHGAPVTSIGAESYDGLVFNFSVEEDESYLAKGFVAHNCACQLGHAPHGLGFADAPPKGEGWQPLKGKRAGAFRRKNTEGEWEYWRPSLTVDALRRGLAFDRDLRKAMISYGESVPQLGVAVRISDPHMREAAEKVVARTPKAVFDKLVGITVITTDTIREGTALDEHDLAYWTGNEIRLSQTLDPADTERVLMHEIGHSLNVLLMNRYGGEAPVRAWHKKLWNVSKKEGFVSKYAKSAPIENAAEATRLYLYDRSRLMLNYPRQFAMLHKAYADALSHPRADLPEGQETL